MFTTIKKLSSHVSTQVGHISDAINRKFVLNFGDAWKRWLFSAQAEGDKSYLDLADRSRPILNDSALIVASSAGRKRADRVQYKAPNANPQVNPSTNRRQSDISHQRLEAYIVLTQERQKNAIDDY